MTYDNLGLPDRCSECGEPIEFCETICPDCRQKIDVMVLVEGTEVRDALILALEFKGRRRCQEMGIVRAVPESWYNTLIREVRHGLYRAWSKPDLSAFIPGTRTVFFSISEDIAYGVMCWPTADDSYGPSLYWLIER